MPGRPGIEERYGDDAGVAKGWLAGRRDALSAGELGAEGTSQAIILEDMLVEVEQLCAEVKGDG